MVEEEQLSKADIISKLEGFGVKVNPGKKKEELLMLLKAEENKASGGGIVPATPVVPLAKEKGLGDGTNEAPMSDMDKIMKAIGGLASSVEGIARRVNRIEQGGKDDFKMDAKADDVVKASASKENIDPRIAKIVEDTLGIDFGVEVKGNSDRPGFELTILVPQRLSHVPNQFRPVRDEITGQYKIDEKTKRVIEEEYWPGDRRSIQLGTTASYDVIQERCNRIRAYIISWYQKMNKPSPEFKIQ